MVTFQRSLKIALACISAAVLIALLNSIKGTIYNRTRNSFQL
jgi:hypothetical protein